MEKEVRISREFSFLLDDSGRTEEIRHYRDEKLVARYVGVYDENDNMIGVKELPPETVAPESLVEKVRKRLFKARTEKPDYLNWIGVINFIGTINRINRINYVGEIEKIKEITTIRDVTQQPKTLIINSDFSSKFAGWITDKKNIEWLFDSVDARTYFMRFAKDKEGYLKQEFPIPWNTDWFSELLVYVRSPATSENILKFTLMYKDGTFDDYGVQVTEADTWQIIKITPMTNKYICALDVFHDSSYKQADLDAIYIIF